MTTFVVLLLLGLGFFFAVRATTRSKSTSLYRPPSETPLTAPEITIRLRSSELGGRSAPSRPMDPVKLAREGDRLWAPMGSEANVASRSISGGMIYVGRSLPAVGGWRESEPALIDPSLEVARTHSPDSGERMGYWPSYDQIAPDARAAYLEWLAGGRSDPNVCIGYVFLFFYGLERRLLFDLQHLPDRRGEAPGLIAEVERLRSIYCGNRSFDGYSSSLLQVSRALWLGGSAWERSPSFDRSGSEVPVEVRFAVGQLVAAGEPIPAEWALAWVLGDPESRLRTPALRCPDEFRELFSRRYSDKFATGMMLKPNKRCLKISHVAASPSFGGAFTVPFEDLPDVASLTRPLWQLREIAEGAMSELDAFSRLVGRSPEKANSLEGLALLPPELAESRRSPASEGLRSWIQSMLGEPEGAIVAVEELMAHWDCGRADRMSKAEVGSLARVLESLGYGIEPDPRFGGGALRVQRKAVVFALGQERLAAGSPSYRAATLLLHLAALVAASEGEVSESEKRHLEKHLEQSMRLTGEEARRLRAHLKWLIAEKPSTAGIRARLQGVEASRRRILADFAIATAATDGVIDRGEIRALTKIYGLLGFDSEQAYGDIHSLQAGDAWRPADGPTTVRPPTAVEFGRPIPSAPSAESQHETIALDMARVERTLAETEAISRVLAEVFAEEPPEPDAPVAKRGEPDTVQGLDTRHSALLVALDDRAELSREEFEALADSLDLLPDGAYETLNELAFDRVDGPLLEGEDPVKVDLALLREMRA